MITNNHVLGEEDLKEGEEIHISFIDDKEKRHSKTIKMDKNRNFVTFKKLNGDEIDATIIELRPGQDKLDEQDFLEIDENLMDGEIKTEYERRDIYIIQYKKGEEIATSDGVLGEIKKGNKSYTLSHTCDTDRGSSGSPIILYNHKVIGLHRGWRPGRKPGSEFNCATLLKCPIQEYYKKLNKKITMVYKIDKKYEE